MTIWCIDLDKTITATPAAMKALMDGLRSQGISVQVLTGVKAPTVEHGAVAAKHSLLASLGMSGSYDTLVVVADPHNDVAAQKVAYMAHVGASVLVDNNKRNCKAATKAGFLALRHIDPKHPVREPTHANRPVPHDAAQSDVPAARELVSVGA
ncbi:MAG TPA: hypothetical protein VF288_10805 [Mycobacteriales bacterium]